MVENPLQGIIVEYALTPFQQLGLVVGLGMAEIDNNDDFTEFAEQMDDQDKDKQRLVELTQFWEPLLISSLMHAIRTIEGYEKIEYLYICTHKKQRLGMDMAGRVIENWDETPANTLKGKEIDRATDEFNEWLSNNLEFPLVECLELFKAFHPKFA